MARIVEDEGKRLAELVDRATSIGLQGADNPAWQRSISTILR